MHPFDLLNEIEKRISARVHSNGANQIQAPIIEGKLALRLGCRNLMVHLGEVSEIIPMPRITRVPSVEPWMLGIANLRGTIISIIDLGRFLEEKAVHRTPSTRAVVFRSHDWGYGLLVDEIVGMRHFGQDSQVSQAQGIPANMQPYITATFQSEDEQWLVFSVDRLKCSARFSGASRRFY